MECYLQAEGQDAVPWSVDIVWRIKSITYKLVGSGSSSIINIRSCSEWRASLTFWE